VRHYATLWILEAALLAAAATVLIVHAALH
jgi:hypothetical protein